MMTGDRKPVALVTGAAGDIGFAAAEMIAVGQTVVLADHPSSVDRLTEKVDLLRSRGHSVAMCTFDVGVRSDVAAAFLEIAETSGPPTNVFNNAGYQGSFQRIDRMDSNDVAKVLTVNVLGVFNVMAEASSLMIEAGLPGSIVNTASMAGVSGAPNMAGYSASKAAVIGLTKSAAKDLAPFQIRVNAISPAFIGPGMMWIRQVEMQANAGSQYYGSDPETVAKQMIDMIPLRRYGSLQEVANVVGFLLSDAASYLTGVNLEVSGGSV